MLHVNSNAPPLINACSLSPSCIAYMMQTNWKPELHANVIQPILLRGLSVCDDKQRLKEKNWVLTGRTEQMAIKQAKFVIASYKFVY